MPFGEVIIGSPGSGKSTYAFGKQQLLTALERPIAVVNLDPANDRVPYQCVIDIASLISLQDAMEEHGLGPNGGMLYCMEYLEANFDWLEEQLRAAGLLAGDAYVLFDVPGQVELSSDHASLKNIIGRLEKIGFRVRALRTHADFNLDFYTEVQDLSYLHNLLSASHSRFSALNEVICDLVEDYGLVAFETLAVEDKSSMLHLMRTIDRALGYIFVPKPLAEEKGDQPKGTVRPNQDAIFSSAMGAIPGHTIQDIQERYEERHRPLHILIRSFRWVDNREEYDVWESREWRQEGLQAAKTQNKR
ncbi:hypothetical protein FRC10_005768 [Ceratobasidium sp. 414]|nr:hypothetical protein FRC10_005768 [Ceratobasidium sp. 414]